jgi:hypothetical protein
MFVKMLKKIWQDFPDQHGSKQEEYILPGGTTWRVWGLGRNPFLAVCLSACLSACAD